MDTKEKVKLVNKYRKTMNVAEACKKVGVAKSVYNYHQYKTKRKSPQVFEVKTAPAKLIAFVGTPGEVVNAIRSLE